MAKPETQKRVLPGWIWALAALAVILLYNAFFTPTFFHLEVKDGRLYGNLIDILLRGSPVMLLSLGMTLVIATGGIDLSVGAVMAVASSLTALLISQNQPFPIALASGFAVAAFLGTWNGVLVIYFGIQPIVATLILLVSGRGIAQLLTGGQIITFTSSGLAWMGGGSYLGLPISIWIVALALVLLSILTRRTALGLFIEAIGESATAARYTGVATKGVTLSVYAITGLLAGVAGLIVTGNVHAADANEVGLYLELDAILAVVIGGTSLTGGKFSLLGSIFGALVIQTLTTTILTKGIPAQTTMVIKALLVLAICLMHSPQLKAKIAGLSRRAA